MRGDVDDVAEGSEVAELAVTDDAHEGGSRSSGASVLITCCWSTAVMLRAC